LSLNLERHGGRTPSGVLARIAQRLLAMAACIWHNWRFHHDRRALADRLPLNDTESLIPAAAERDVERARAAWRPAP
jgi:hypothetical protein